MKPNRLVVVAIAIMLLTCLGDLYGQEEEDMKNVVDLAKLRELSMQRFYENNYQQAIEGIENHIQQGEYAEALKGYREFLYAEAQDVSPYWIGVQCEPAESVPILSDLPNVGRLFHRGGLTVNSVTEDSPAYKGGIREGDVIFSFNDSAVNSIAELTEGIRQAGESECSVQIIREERPLTLTVVPAKRPEMPEQSDYSTTQEYNNAWAQYWVDQQARDPWSGRYWNSGYSNYANLVALPEDLEVSLTFKGSNPPTIKFKRDDEEWSVENWDASKLPEDLHQYYWSFVGLYGANYQRAEYYPNYGINQWNSQWNNQWTPYGQFKELYGGNSSEKDELIKRIDDMAKQLDALRETVESIKKD